MKKFYVGKCKKCGTINAAVPEDSKEVGIFLKDMVDSNLDISTLNKDIVLMKKCYCNVDFGDNKNP